MKNHASNARKIMPTLHFRIRFIFISLTNLWVSGSRLSSAKRSGDTSLRLIGLDWLQSLKQKPKTQHHFENGHRRIEQPIVNDFVEVREDEKNQGANDAPGRRDHTEKS